MKRATQRAAFAAVVLCGSALSAAADPITAFYDVHVLYRYSARTNTTEAYNQQFVFSLTFDPANATDMNRTYSYGPPSFSPVPLPVAAPPPGVTLDTQAFTIHEAHATDLESYAPYTLWSIAQLDRQSPKFAAESYDSFVVLESFQIHLQSLRATSAASFPADLAGPNAQGLYGTNFQYGGIGMRFHPDPIMGYYDYAPNSYRYYGNATLVSSTHAPTPEPGTLMLIGTGLVAGVRGFRRRR